VQNVRNDSREKRTNIFLSNCNCKQTIGSAMPFVWHLLLNKQCPSFSNPGRILSPSEWILAICNCQSNKLQPYTLFLSKLRLRPERVFSWIKRTWFQPNRWSTQRHFRLWWMSTCFGLAFHFFDKSASSSRIRIESTFDLVWISWSLMVPLRLWWIETAVHFDCLQTAKFVGR
jgi:hypothetical protein